MQGVGFRYFVAREAQRLGLAGFVRNVGSRQVELVAEGSRESLAQLAAAVGEGPPGARVEDLQLSWGETERASPGFAVRPSQH